MGLVYRKLGLALALMSVSTGVWSAPSLEGLTSKKTAKKINNKIPGERPNAEPPIPSELKIHSLGIGLGQTFLKGDFSRYGEDQITVDLLYNYSASHSFDLLINAHFSKHRLAQNRLKISGMAVGIKGKLYQLDSFSPIVIVGLGFYVPVATRPVHEKLVKSKSKVVFGTHGGVGGELILNRRYSVGLVGTLHNPFDVQQGHGPEVEGYYSKLMITAFYRF